MVLNENHLASIKCLLLSASKLLCDALSIAQAVNSPPHIMRLTILRRRVLNEIEDLGRESGLAVKDAKRGTSYQAEAAMLVGPDAVLGLRIRFAIMFYDSAAQLTGGHAFAGSSWMAACALTFRGWPRQV